MSRPQKERELTPYKILGLAEHESDLEKINKAYKKLCLECHPDRVMNRLKSEGKDAAEIDKAVKESNKRFLEIQTAYKKIRYTPAPTPPRPQAKPERPDELTAENYSYFVDIVTQIIGIINPYRQDVPIYRDIRDDVVIGVFRKLITSNSLRLHEIYLLGAALRRIASQDSYTFNTQDLAADKSDNSLNMMVVLANSYDGGVALSINQVTVQNFVKKLKQNKGKLAGDLEAFEKLVLFYNYYQSICRDNFPSIEIHLFLNDVKIFFVETSKKDVSSLKSKLVSLGIPEHAMKQDEKGHVYVDNRWIEGEFYKTNEKNIPTIKREFRKKDLTDLLYTAVTVNSPVEEIRDLVKQLESLEIDIKKLKNENNLTLFEVAIKWHSSLDIVEYLLDEKGFSLTIFELDDLLSEAYYGGCDADCFKYLFIKAEQCFDQQSLDKAKNEYLKNTLANVQEKFVLSDNSGPDNYRDKFNIAAFLISKGAAVDKEQMKFIFEDSDIFCLNFETVRVLHAAARPDLSSINSEGKNIAHLCLEAIYKKIVGCAKENRDSIFESLKIVQFLADNGAPMNANYPSAAFNPLKYMQELKKDDLYPEEQRIIDEISRQYNQDLPELGSVARDLPLQREKREEMDAIKARIAALKLRLAEGDEGLKGIREQSEEDLKEIWEQAKKSPGTAVKTRDLPKNVKDDKKGSRFRWF